MLFFFSSRRRHTRSLRDWSSDVCSSDLCLRATQPRAPRSLPDRKRRSVPVPRRVLVESVDKLAAGFPERRRSEERRVGKECRSRWSPYQEKKESWKQSTGSLSTSKDAAR